MKKIIKIISNYFCVIGNNPLPFFGGFFTAIIGFILGIAFMLSLK